MPRRRRLSEERIARIQRLNTPSVSTMAINCGQTGARWKRANTFFSCQLVHFAHWPDRFRGTSKPEALLKACFERASLWTSLTLPARRMS